MRTNYYLATFIGTAAVVLVSQSSVGQSTNLYSQARQSVVLIQNTARARQGTGFIVSRDNGTYYVLTAGHVVRNGQFQVRTDSGEIRPIEIVLPLPGTDLALLQFTSSRQYPVAKLANNANTAQASARIFILGYPSNGSGDPEIPGGNVTSRQNPGGNSPIIAHNVLTVPGMSGSPLLTENGEVVGIHVGQPVQSGFGEAIPIERYRESIPSVITQAARANLEVGRFAETIASIEEGRRLGVIDNPDTSVILAYAYFGLENFDRAREEARKISSNANAALLLGAINYIRGDYSNAINNGNLAANLDSRNLGIYALAIVGLSQAQNQLSLQDANLNTDRAVTSFPSDPFINFVRSCVRIKSGDIDGARAFFNRGNNSGRQLTDPYLAILSSKLQQTVVKECLSELGSPIPTSPSSNRYRSSAPINLGVSVTTVAVSNDSQSVATGLGDGNVYIYNLPSRSRTKVFSSGQDGTPISSVAFSPDGRSIAIASASGQVKVFDIQSRREKYNLANVGNSPVVVFSNNGRYLFIGSSSGTLRMVDNASNEIIVADPNAHRDGISSLNLSSDGRLLASGGSDGLVKLWRTSDLTPVDSYQAHQGGVQSLTFSTDGNRIISIGGNEVKSCDWQKKECTQVASSREALGTLAVASNGQIAFSDNSFLIKPDNPIFLQDLRTGQSLGNLSGHSDRVTALAYTPNSRFLISGSSDKTIIIWEVQ